MCGIIGYFNFKDAIELVSKGLETIKDRGVDGLGIATEKEITKGTKIKKIASADNAVGHRLHAIVNCVHQPLEENNSRFMINGEIYNWKELDKKHNLKSKNDSEAVFKLINKLGLEKTLDQIEGVYALCYWKGDDVYLVRDIIGVKPLWFSVQENLSFCSEKKVLEQSGIESIQELNPRLIINYNIKTKKIKVTKRKFFDILPEHKIDKAALLKKTKSLLQSAITKRIPDQEFGILFSGGIDSTFIAYVCKKLGLNFTCYTAALNSQTEAQDLTESKRVAKALGLKLKYKLIELDEIPKYLKKLVPLIEDSNVVKVGVGLTFYVACELAKKDNIKVIFSGLGSEEIFAGYERHKKSSNINQECLSGVRKIYERDMYRDDVITMNNNLELRLPFLDTKLIKFALKIPDKFKIVGNQTKVILRDVAEEMGIETTIAQRPKKAAQYGSRFDAGLIKLAKKNKFKLRSEYLKQFYNKENVKLAALVSGGKDSIYAMHIMQRQNYDISCMVSIKSENQDSYMYHTPNIDLVELQAEACQIPLIVQTTKGEKEKELQDLKTAIKKAIKNFNIGGIVLGAIFSSYQRDRVEKIADELGIKVFTPLWHMDQELLMRNVIDEGFEFIFSSIAADGLDKSWLATTITEEHIEKLVKINNKIGTNIAGEGGEFESFVLAAPMFKKSIKITKTKVEMENSITGRVHILNAKLE